jgi:RND family efflux transporter MFP subunit
VLRAPFSGIIAERAVEVGGMVVPGMPVGILLDDSTLRARVELDPQVALDLRAGAEVSVEAYARPGDRFEGRVLSVGAALDPMSRRLPIEVEILDPERRLRAGLLARFTVSLDAPRARVFVVPDAVFERGERSYVYVVQEGRVQRRAVELGVLHNGHREILRGLQAGEPVVVAGQARLTDRARVRIVPPHTDTDAAQHARSTHP